MKKNKDVLIAVSLTYGLLLIAIMFYLIWGRKYIEIPTCPIYKLTGMYCPICGSTRAVVSLLNGEIIRSFLYNPIIIYVFVFSTLYIITETVNTELRRKSVIQWKIIIYVGLAILIINCIIQNITKLAFNKFILL